MTLRFDGDFEALQRLVRDLKCQGEWRMIQDGAQFKERRGAVLNWYERNGTVVVGGTQPHREDLEKKLTTLLEDGELVAEEAPETAPAEPAPAARKARKKTKVVEEEAKVFVVHGHDNVAREQLELILHKLGLDPFVLANTGGGGHTIIEALEQETGPGPGRCRFGIVLMTPDDVGYAKKDGPEKAEPRARQNVILEMGMLFAAIGRDKVAILRKGHLEAPSDVGGIIWIGFNDHVKETVPKLADRLRDAGFELDQKAITLAST